VEHLSATLQGLSIIRAYNAEKRFYDKEVELIDCNHKCFFGFEMAARWLGWRLDFMAAGVVIATGIFILVLKNVITASLGGLVLTYALQMAGVFQWSVRSMAETESLMTSVERLVHYTKNIQSEAPQIIPTNRPPAHWPDKGEIIYKDVDVRYRENAEPALQGISFHVNPKEKIGIVGRTGSGKTTLAMTLFRIVELNRGKIIIDGYDISKIGLTDLRSKLAIIPQEPVLFIGTIRSNLDPFSQYSEQQLWDTLERVSMHHLISGNSIDFVKIFSF
jgi:ABC-type multidrug transport system fused ATPase/permease subunit